MIARGVFKMTVWTNEAEKLRKTSNGKPMTMKLLDYRFTKEFKVAGINRGHTTRKVNK